jgi:hypothetical protein
MYLWKVDKLVDEFRSEGVTEKEKFKYIVLFYIAMTVASDPLLHSDNRYTYMDSLNLILLLGTVVAGTYFCYVQNRHGDNTDFITRFICLGLPIVVRVLVFALPILFIVGFIQGTYKIGVYVDEHAKEFSTTTFVQVVANFLLSGIYYLYLGKKIRAVSGYVQVQQLPRAVELR